MIATLSILKLLKFICIDTAKNIEGTKITQNNKRTYEPHNMSAPGGNFLYDQNWKIANVIESGGDGVAIAPSMFLDMRKKLVFSTPNIFRMQE